MAAAWAVLHYLGDEGHLRFASRIYEATKKIVAGIKATPGLRLLAEPDTNLIAFTADEFSVFHIIDEMKPKGWLLQPQLGYMGSIDNVHLSIGQSNFEQVDDFLRDLRDAVARARAIPNNPVVHAVKAEAAKLGPKDMTPANLAKLMDVAGMSGGRRPARMADLNQILNAFPPKMCEMAMTELFNNTVYEARRGQV
jgi:glutamate/tyrosine decarboxylase-like PLP-dependent enzyme